MTPPATSTERKCTVSVCNDPRATTSPALFFTSQTRHNSPDGTCFLLLPNVPMYTIFSTHRPERGPWKTHQDTLRAEVYSTMRTVVQNPDPLNPRAMGRRVILPSSFVGGPRYMNQLYHDGMAIVRKVGPRLPVGVQPENRHFHVPLTSHHVSAFPCAFDNASRFHVSMSL